MHTYLWQLEVFFSLQPRLPKTAPVPELHCHFINSFIQPSLVGFLIKMVKTKETFSKLINLYRMLEKDNPNFDPEATDQNKYLTTCNPEPYDSCIYNQMEKRMMAEVGCTVPYLPNVDDKICATNVRNGILLPNCSDLL